MCYGFLLNPRRVAIFAPRGLFVGFSFFAFLAWNRSFIVLVSGLCSRCALDSESGAQLAELVVFATGSTAVFVCLRAIRPISLRGWIATKVCFPLVVLSCCFVVV